MKGYLHSKLIKSLCKFHITVAQGQNLTDVKINEQNFPPGSKRFSQEYFSLNETISYSRMDQKLVNVNIFFLKFEKKNNILLPINYWKSKRFSLRKDRLCYCKIVFSVKKLNILIFDLSSAGIKFKNLESCLRGLTHWTGQSARCICNSAPQGVSKTILDLRGSQDLEGRKI